MYFPIPAGIEQSSFAYTPLAFSGLSFNVLTPIFSQGILHTCDDIICSSVVFYTLPVFLLINLWYLPSTNQALDIDQSFIGISATSSVQLIFRLCSIKRYIPRFTLWLSPCITNGSMIKHSSILLDILAKVLLYPELVVRHFVHQQSQPCSPWTRSYCLILLPKTPQRLWQNVKRFSVSFNANPKIFCCFTLNPANDVFLFLSFKLFNLFCK